MQRTRNYTKTINFTPEQIDKIKAYRDKLVEQTGHKYSLSETVIYLIKDL